MVTNNSANIPTGATGKFCQGQGAGVALNLSTATYPSTATGTGKILRADGTNWVASTATYPDTAGTSGNVLTSDGTNWISSASTSNDGITTVTGSLTNSQIKNLHGTPILFLAAQGSGKIIRIVSSVGKMNYGGTNVFIAAFGQRAALFYGAPTTEIGGIIGNAQITAASTQIIAARPDVYSTVVGAYSLADNQAVYIYNPVAIEIAGNAANNNTITYSVSYQIITI